MKLDKFSIAGLSEYSIPAYMHDGIIGYYENGWLPGGFLSAIIDNDLRGAFERADNTNEHCIKNYLLWFYNCAPAGTWGYPGARDEYLEKFHKEARNNAK